MKKSALCSVSCLLLLAFVVTVQAQEDLDANGVLDINEQALIEKFCPSLVLGKSDIAVGDNRAIQVCPEPVEMLINNLWNEVMNQEGEFRGSYRSQSYEMYEGLFYMNRSWIDDYSIPAPCGTVDQGWRRWHFDFGGTGCGDMGGNGESGYVNDQPAGWGKVYADGNAYTQSGADFANTVYAHVYALTGAARVIQYWFYYPYNDWVSDHEGDWEHIDVHISSPDTALAVIDNVVFYFHEKYKTAYAVQSRVAPGAPFDCYVMDGSHPVVFVGGKWTKEYAGSHGGGPGSHGSYPIYGEWSSVVDVAKDGLHAFWLGDIAEGDGLFVPWYSIVDDDQSDRDGVILIKNPEFYSPETDPQMGWLKASTWWGHPKVKSFGSDLAYDFATGNEAPNGPAKQETWGHSDEDTGRFHRYNGWPAGIDHVSDVPWTQPPTVAVTSPAQNEIVSNIAQIRGTIHYADAVSIEYGVGSSPTSWATNGLTLSWSSDNVGREVTIGSWNVGAVPSGTYTIRVRSTYGAHVFDALRTVSVQHKSITVAHTGGDFANIQAAIDFAQMGDTIRVDGTSPYYNSSITMKPAVHLTATAGTAPELWGQANTPTLTIANHDYPCVIEGITFRHNYIFGYPGAGSSEQGATVDDASPVFRNCVFTGNSASFGGGVLVKGDSRPVFEDCSFAGNWVSDNGGGLAIASSYAATSVECRRCLFENNLLERGYTGPDAGAAVGLWNATASQLPPSLFEDCTFMGNGTRLAATPNECTISLKRAGGAEFVGCVFVNNSTKTLASMHESSPVFDKCTFANNTGVDGIVAWWETPAAVQLSRSIVANNAGPLAVGNESLSSSIALQKCLLYSNVDQGRGPADTFWAGVGQQNYRMSPAFCNAAGGDYHLYAFSPAAAPAPPNPGYFGERVGAYDVGCVPPAVVTVTARPVPRFSTKPWIVVACPKGDLDTLQVTVDLNGTITRNIDRREIVLDADLDAGDVDTATVFDQSGFLEAEADAVGPTYVAKIKHPFFGGHGNDTVSVLLNGHPLASQAHFEIRSVDMSGNGVVDLADFAQFGGGYPSPPKPYARYCDFAPPEYTATLPDFAVYGAHAGHTKPAGSQQLNDELPESNAGVALQFTEEFPTANTHRLYVDVSAKNFDGVTTAVFSMQGGSERLSFANWIPVNGSIGEVMFTPVIRDGAEQLFFGVLVSETFSGTEATLGRLVFDVSGTESMEVTEDNFVLTFGEVLEDAPASGLVVASMESVFARTVDSEVARVYHDRLEQNFPNPFNPTTTLAFSIKNAENVNLTIYDVAGRRVRELVNEHRDRGAFKVVWDGQNDAGQIVASGVYFYKLIAGSFTDTKKMTILK